MSSVSEKLGSPPDTEMTLVEAAARLRVPWHTAYKWVLTGTLRGRQMGGRWFVSRQDVEELARSRERPADAASG